MTSQLRIMTSSYLDTDHNLRCLVSVYDDETPVQTVGSWLITDPCLLAAIRAATYTLNAVRGTTSC